MKLETFADLCCGIGGFHYAAKQHGLRGVFAADIDAKCRRAYEHNHGLTPEGDLFELDAKKVPSHDLLMAGFPCQSFSICGDRAGFEDTRGTVFFEIARIIKAKKPKAVILENVKNLRGHNKGKTLARIISVLEGLGYSVTWKILNALEFGLPQHRTRIVIVAIRGGLGKFRWPDSKPAYTPLAEILEENPDRKHFASKGIRASRKAKHKPACKPSIWHENKSGNVSSHPYSCALRAGASHNYLLVNGERRLTPREMLRLQGFPDSFEIACSDHQTRKQAGNAVPVPMVAAVIKEILNA